MDLALQETVAAVEVLANKQGRLRADTLAREGMYLLICEGTVVDGMDRKFL
jgi:hypothetical protein